MGYEEVQIFNNRKCIKYFSKVILQEEDLLKMVMKEYFFFSFYLVWVSFCTQMLRYINVKKTNGRDPEKQIFA